MQLLLRALALAALVSGVAANARQYAYTQTVGAIRPANSPPADAFTRELLITADGKEVIAGAHAADFNGVSDVGFVAIYAYNAKGKTLDEVQRLTPERVNPLVGDQYGLGLALSGNEKWLAVSDTFAPGTNGTVLVFMKKRGRWVKGTEVLNPNQGFTGLNNVWGHSVALSKDGGTLVVSALNYFSPGDAVKRGAIYVYKRGKGRVLQYRLAQGPITPVANNTNFGFALSITPDAKYIAVGATNAGGGHGAVYIYKLNKQTGLYALEPGSPIAPYNTASDFGFSLKFSPNSKYLGVCAPVRNGGRGALTILRKSSMQGTYTVTQADVTPPGPNTATDHPLEFCADLAFSADSKYLAVGQTSSLVNNVVNNDGMVWFLTAQKGLWKVGPNPVVPSPAGQRFGLGFSVAISKGAKVLAGGARNFLDAFTGRLYMFNRGQAIKP